MTAKNRSTLAALFQNGDTPQGSDYSDVFDSFVNLTDSSAQTITSKLVISGGVETPNVSALTFNTPIVSAESIITSAMRAITVSSNSEVTDILRVNTSANFGLTGQMRIAVSGDNNLLLNIDTTVAASAGVSGPATPTSVAGFIPIVINGTKRLIAFYNVKP